MNKIIKTTKTILSQKKINYLDNKFKKTESISLQEKLLYLRSYESWFEKSKYNPVIFLNSGDTFIKISSLNTISKHIKQNSKKCLMFVSILKNNQDYFSPKKKTFFNENFLTHSSFIRPPNKMIKVLILKIRLQLTVNG